MGIPLGGGRRSRRNRRRSYADYRPATPRKRPVDFFWVILLILVLAGSIWAWRNQEQVRGFIAGRLNLMPDIGEQFPTGIGGGEPVSDSGKGQEQGKGEATIEPNQSAEELAAQGETAYLAGNLLNAITYYREAAAAAPNNVEYHYQLARMLLFQAAMEHGEQRDKTLKEALDAGNRTILADPTRPEGYAITGKVYDWMGEYGQAQNLITQALDIDPNFAPAKGFLAEALTDLSRWEQALATAEEAVAADPNNVDTRRDYGYVLETLGYYNEAVEQYKAGLALHPNLPYLRMALGRTYRTLGPNYYQLALDEFFAVETLDPTSVLIPWEIGYTYESFVGDPNSAMKYYEHATEIDDTYAMPWARIGALYVVQDNYVQAIPALERAIALGQKEFSVYYRLGLSYAMENNCLKALPNLAEAQRLAGSDETYLGYVQDALDLCGGDATLPTPTPTPGQ